jgi:probable HAF family extracellular repeat protein
LIPGFPELRSVLWENGVIHDLGTLPGGYESYSSAISNRGQVVGVASNAIPDANSMSFPGYQARAFLWDKQRGMQDLGALSGGTDAIAVTINQPGQVIGWSYTSSAPNANCINGYTLVTGSFIWDEKNGMEDLGGFGGTCTLATDLNDKGQVVGTSNLTGDRATGIIDLGTLGGSISEGWAINEKGDAVGGSFLSGHQFENAVRWRKTGGRWQATNLGTVNDSNCSFAFSINVSGQIVGISGTNCALAFLWEDGGPMVDLNTLLSSDSGIQVYGVATINDRGEIAASGVDANGNNHALLLIPCDEQHQGIEGCDYSLVRATTVAQVHAPQAGQTQSGALRNGNPIGLRGRLPSAIARRYHIPGGMNGSER